MEVDEDAEEGESNDGVDSYDETVIGICADDDDDVDDEDAAVDKTTPNRNATGRAAAVRSFISENGILGPPGISKEKFAEEFPHAGATALRLLPQVLLPRLQRQEGCLGAAADGVCGQW